MLSRNTNYETPFIVTSPDTPSSESEEKNELFDLDMSGNIPEDIEEAEEMEDDEEEEEEIPVDPPKKIQQSKPKKNNKVQNQPQPQNQKNNKGGQNRNAKNNKRSEKHLEISQNKKPILSHAMESAFYMGLIVQSCATLQIKNAIDSAKMILFTVGHAAGMNVECTCCGQ